MWEIKANWWQSQTDESLRAFWDVFLSFRLFLGASNGTKAIPPKNWLFTPSVEKTSANVYEVFGREIYFSDVDKMLTTLIRYIEDKNVSL